MNFNHRLTQIASIKSSIDNRQLTIVNRQSSIENLSRAKPRDRQSNNGFTLIELVIAVAILAMVLSFAGVIFRVCIETYRASVANAEIMQKLRAITDQLNADFKGLRLDAPLLIRFNQDSSTSDPNRYDRIMFFADGDFTSIQLYDYSLKPKAIPSEAGDRPVKGNVARIHYAQAQPDPNLLARRRHILTADPDLYDWPLDISMTDFDDGAGAYKLNEWYEHDRLSLSEWKTIDAATYGDPIIPVCFGTRPLIDMEDPNTFHKLMCDGVASFAVQWAYWDSVDNKFYWFPSDDPDGSGTYSHFDLMDNKDRFGVYFNIPGSIPDPDWYSIGDAETKCSQDFYDYPKALRFTFTLYDSKGVIKKGREFTHIVYLEN